MGIFGSILRETDDSNAVLHLRGEGNILWLKNVIENAADEEIEIVVKIL